MPPNPDYFDKDGDWVKRHPVRLGDATLYAFVVPAQKDALAALCNGLVNDRPTGGTVSAEPLLPAVILVYADIKRLRSEDREHGQLGFLHEQDVAFFVPVRRTHHGQREIASLVPYIFVDNGAGVIAGREIYGFPKEFATIGFRDEPLGFEARSLVFRERNPDQPATDELVVGLESGKFSLLPQVHLSARAVTAALTATVFAELRLNPLEVLGAVANGFDVLGLLFLKQFRDAMNSMAACHQSLVQAQGTIENLNDVAIVTGDFRVSLPQYESLNIADQLGLSPRVDLHLGFSAKLDLVVDRGTVLWSAG